ncbi:MAG TPA: LacI family transcriptional regulator [Lachnospiraceae bacterium]|nr:LacI family transcriptional regulator [Lachnospiraceae bacterium]
MTIKEIADLAGVSSAAVSRYLNGGSLSNDKRRRIGEIIEQTNYKPSAYARAMRTKRSYQIGVILPNIESESGPRVVSGISSVLHQAGYNFLLADTEDTVERELNYLELFRNSQLDGLILVASAIDQDHLSLLNSIRIPLVIIGQNIKGYSCIYHNDRQAACEMMTLLLSSGCKFPAYIGVTEHDIAAGAERTAGVKQALERMNIPSEHFSRREASFTIESGEEQTQLLLTEHPETDGIFCATDLIAIGAMKAIRKAGLRIPEDIRLCGIGNHPLSDMIHPGLTTVQYHYKASGQKAANLLLDMIAHPGQTMYSEKLNYQLIRRESL